MINFIQVNIKVCSILNECSVKSKLIVVRKTSYLDSINTINKFKLLQWPHIFLFEAIIFFCLFHLYKHDTVSSLFGIQLFTYKCVYLFQ